jgi:hypothetical protein
LIINDLQADSGTGDRYMLTVLIKTSPLTALQYPAQASETSKLAAIDRSVVGSAPKSVGTAVKGFSEQSTISRSCIILRWPLSISCAQQRVWKEGPLGQVLSTPTSRHSGSLRCEAS